MPAREHRRRGIGPREARRRAARSAARAAGESRSAFEQHARERARPGRASRVARIRACSAVECGTWCSSKSASKSRGRARRARGRHDAALVHRVLRRDGAARRARRPGAGSAPAGPRTSAAAPRPRRARGAGRRRARAARRASGCGGSRRRATPTGFTERPPSRIRMRLPSLRRRSARSTSWRLRARDLHGVVEAEEVRRGEEHHVQQVALDPLAGVVEPPQRAHRRVERRRPRPPRARAPRSSGRRPGRCRRCAPSGPAARRRGGRAANASKKRGGS